MGQIVQLVAIPGRDPDKAIRGCQTCMFLQQERHPQYWRCGKYHGDLCQTVDQICGDRNDFKDWVKKPTLFQRIKLAVIG